MNNNNKNYNNNKRTLKGCAQLKFLWENKHMIYSIRGAYSLELLNNS